MTMRQQAIVNELYNRDYFYTRTKSSRELVLTIVKRVYPSVRMSHIMRAIELELERVGK